MAIKGVKIKFSSFLFIFVFLLIFKFLFLLTLVLTILFIGDFSYLGEFALNKTGTLPRFYG